MTDRFVILAADALSGWHGDGITRETATALLPTWRRAHYLTDVEREELLRLFPLAEPVMVPGKDYLPGSPWTAIFWRHYSEYRETFDSLDEALKFLKNGEYEGDLSAHSVLGPDGAIAISKDEMFDAVYGRRRFDEASRNATLAELTAKHAPAVTL